MKKFKAFTEVLPKSFMSHQFNEANETINKQIEKFVTENQISDYAILNGNFTYADDYFYLTVHISYSK